ncbi:hypothetical protein TNCV_2115401 [Trichonephila clavipes]|nr:hypothetical protein TNCV_2115401 [Trichonephila clavipes]
MPPNTLRVHTEYVLVKSVDYRSGNHERKKSNLSQAPDTFIPSLRDDTTTITTATCPMPNHATKAHHNVGLHRLR